MKKIILYIFLIIIISIPSVFSIVPQPLIYYTFDNADLIGTDPLDVEGTTNNGTNTGADTGAVGIMGESFDFTDGEGDRIDLNKTDCPASWSLSLWANSDAGAFNRDIFNKNGDSGVRGYFQGGGDAYAYRLVVNANSTLIGKYSIDDWEHYVITKNSSGIHWYTNGTFMVNDSHSGFDCGTKYWELGDTILFEGEHDGQLDEFGFWDTSLSQSQVTELWNSGNALNHSLMGSIATINITTKFPTNNSYHNTTLLNINATVNSSTNFNCSLYINSTLNQTFNNYTSGNNINVSFNLTFQDTTEETYEYYFNCINSENEVNSSVIIFTIDDVRPLLTWFDPEKQDTISPFNLSTNINLSDTNLFRLNYTIWYPNGTLYYEYAENNLTYNNSWKINKTVNFTQEFNYTISVEAIDSHTYGDLNGLTYSYDGDDIVLLKGVNTKRLSFGDYKNNKLSKHTEENITQKYSYSNGEYKFEKEYDKSISSKKLGYAISKENIILINKDIGHFVWMEMNGFKGWYFDFSDWLNKGYDINIEEDEEYYYVYTSTDKCKKERCKI